ncbi:MAG: DUF1343 domain-containing protein [Proteobacteria bacterium]|nr:DUF1343 domain-containing protein [Pseudomonadota bacterium]
MRHFFLSLLCLTYFALPAAAVELGIDNLESRQFEQLKGKRVGLITNQTGVNAAGRRTREILAKAPGVKLVSLFTPEHGLDGKELAGKYVANRKDSLTGLVAHSLYGPTRKPTPEMLRGLDVLVYDMQDIGVRSYTYISTMAKCMEAAGESGLEFMVLDRPNPLGGLRIEGPPVEPQWISFVGQLPVPYVHGMTCGELARMLNDRQWMASRCRLTVVKMRGWERQMIWQDTGLRWVQTSPNIPRADSPAYYVATGIVGSLAGLETGVGGATPFEICAGKGWDWLFSLRLTVSPSRICSLSPRLKSSISFSKSMEAAASGTNSAREPQFNVWRRNGRQGWRSFAPSALGICFTDGCGLRMFCRVVFTPFHAYRSIWRQF